ncbi:MAG: GIY-YIG nuclease family protein [Bacteroidota bacterium]
MSYSVYILYSTKFDRYYIGQTNNMDNRIKRHNNGYVKSTKPYRPWRIAFQTTTEDRKSAVRLENQLKSSKSREKILEFINSDQNIVKK